jgi:ribonucleoside-diphosphate reductase alpha chain
MTVRELSNYIFTGKYANDVRALRRRETRDEARRRMFDMHRAYYLTGDVPDDCPSATVPDDRVEALEALIDEAESAFADGLALGSQRALQYAGAPVLRKHARAYNCCFSFADRPRFFQEAFWLLLCGSGTGFSVQWHHVARLPAIKRPGADSEFKEFVIPDTIEGWADALGVLLSSYFDSDDTPFPEYRGKIVTFAYRLIRPEGSPLSTNTGKAPGPSPLRRSLEKIRDLLDRCCDRNALNGHAEFGSLPAYDLHHQGQLQPVDVYDIVMHASDAVLAGGVRRSASICLFSPSDLDMARAKTGNWLAENPQRGRSNNSALLLRQDTSYDDYRQLIELSREWGEPGVVWSDSTEMGVNPCVEASFWPVDIDTGESGWQFCNLSLGNMGAVRTMADARRALRAAAIMGTLQAGYTSFPYLGPVSERITRREALLGVSMTGMAECPEIAFDEARLRELAQLVLDTNAEVAALLGINVAARATCIKPEGTSSGLLGTSSGIHDHHAPRTIRHVQANRNEVQAQFFARHNSHAIEASVWRDKDLILSFAIQPRPESRFRHQTSALDMLRRVALVKTAWVDSGKRPEACTRPWISHNVSNTINVGDGEWDEVTRFIYEHRDVFAGVSLLSEGGDLDYPQAPFVGVLDPHEILQAYGRWEDGDYELIDDVVSGFSDLWDGIEPRTRPENELVESVRSAWTARFQSFATLFFDGDRKRAGHYLKALFYWRKWQALVSKTVPVDYTQMVEEESSVDFGQIVACAGGSCQVL